MRAPFTSPYWILKTSKYYTKYIPFNRKPADLNVLHMTEIVGDAQKPQFFFELTLLKVNFRIGMINQ
jgi:hypothetical protein